MTKSSVIFCGDGWKQPMHLSDDTQMLSCRRQRAKFIDCESINVGTKDEATQTIRHFMQNNSMQLH